jgi:hypothetical protein
MVWPMFLCSSASSTFVAVMIASMSSIIPMA